MFRFVILCTVFFLLYIGFVTIGEFDSSVTLIGLEYHIKTTVFVCIALFMVMQLFLMIIFKAIFLIFDLPEIIKNSWYKRKLKKVNERLIATIGELLMGNREKSLELTNKLIKDIESTEANNESNKDIKILIQAESETNFDKKIHFLRELLTKKYYNMYATRKIAQLFFERGYYKEAEEYAMKAFNESDTQLMVMLIRIYAKLELWSKIVFIASRFHKADPNLFLSYAGELSGYYYLAAKSYLAIENDADAMNILKLSLELKPNNLDALNLFTELNVNNNNSVSTLKILKSAFVSHPCFEIAEMYIKCSKSSTNVIYGTLAGLVKPSENNALFLLIAAYLGLYDKIAEINSPKLINYESKN